MQKGSVKDLDNLIGIDPLVKIFCDLISFDTTADGTSKSVPSSVGQLRFGAHLVSLINAIGYEAVQDEHGVVTVRIAASEGCENVKSLCLLAHMDTAPDSSGSNIRAMLVKAYNGEGIELENGLI